MPFGELNPLLDPADEEDGKEGWEGFPGQMLTRVGGHGEAQE